MAQQTIRTEHNPARGEHLVPCPLCGGTDLRRVVSHAADYEYGLPGDFFVSQCRSCGLLSQNPRPDFSDILRYYTDAYEPYRTVGSSLIQTIRDAVLVKPRVARCIKRIGEHGAVLDVGCSTGEWLHTLARFTQYDLYGVEPVEHAARLARESGLRVHTGLLEQGPWPDESFDLLTMNHVLEHVPDPKAVVEKSLSLLRPAGWLMGELPCAQCAERLVFGKYWQGYHLPRHITWFTPATLSAFLKKTGFRAVSISLQPQPSSWQISLRNRLFGKNPRGRTSTLLSGHNTMMQILTLPVSLALFAAGMAPILRFAAQKPESRP